MSWMNSVDTETLPPSLTWLEHQFPVVMITCFNFCIWLCVFFSFSLDHRPQCLWSRQQPVGGRLKILTTWGERHTFLFCSCQDHVFQKFCNTEEINQKLVEKKWQLVASNFILANSWVQCHNEFCSVLTQTTFKKRKTTNQLFLTS